MDSLFVTGQRQGLLETIDEGNKTHLLLPEVANSWRKFQLRAREAGFKPVLVSAYRDFNRQLAIWNAKALGLRPVLDDKEVPLDMSVLSEQEKVHAIMRFTALPGASRHHWGTDIDIVDTSRMPSDYAIQLTVAETCGDGPCAEFYRWLDGQDTNSIDFKRPYQFDNGGIAIEPWHFSHVKMAAKCEDLMSPALIMAALESEDMALKETVLAEFDELYERYISVRNP